MSGIFKYSGAGNDFIVLDGRGKDLSEYRHVSRIRVLCDRKSGFRAADGRIGADGLMILSDPAAAPSGPGSVDFKMEFFNPDGSNGMMCGNGGRCITAFAAELGIRPASGGEYAFEAADGLHLARILRKEGDKSIVRLLMAQPSGLKQYPEGWFINTGARHLVRFVDDLESLDVAAEGSSIRHDKAFAPEGVNVDFVSIEAEGRSWSKGARPSHFAKARGPLPLEPRAASPFGPISCPSATLAVRTFEKGVEAETQACGTGIVAAALVFNHLFPESASRTITVHARKDDLEVEISPQEVWLTGPAELIHE